MRGSTGAAAPLAPLTVTDFSAVRQRPAHASGKNTGFFCCLPTSGTCVRKEYRIQVSAHRKDFPFRRILYTITPYTEKPRPAFTGRDCVVLFSFRLSGLRSRQTLFSSRQNSTSGSPALQRRTDNRVPASGPIIPFAPGRFKKNIFII